MASRDRKYATGSVTRRTAKLDIPRGSARRPSGRTGSYSRASYSGRAGASGHATPRVSSMKVGDFSYGSAYSVRMRESRRSYMGTVIAVLVVIGLLVAVGFGVYWSSLFSIKKVTVSGVEHLTSQEMTLLANVPSDSTLLRVDTSAIESNIMRDAWVSDVSVKRVFPDTLELAVTEREIGATAQIGVEEGKSTVTWAISSDGLWLCSIPEEGTEESKSVSPQIYKDAKKVFCITDVAYGVQPEVGAYCKDESIVNALDIVTGLTTDLKKQVKTVSATSPENTTLTLKSNVEIAFGTAEDIRDKERVCLEIMDKHPNKVAYINVRVLDSPTWRAA